MHLILSEHDSPNRIDLDSSFLMTNIFLLLRTSGLNVKVKNQFDGTCTLHYFFNFQTGIVTSSSNT